MAKEGMEVKPVGFWEAFWFWVKLGFINFGGACGSDRHHAPGVGREETVGLRGPVLEVAQLLHVIAWPGGPAGRDVHRVEVTRDGRGDRGWFLLRDPIDLRIVAPLVPGRSPFGRAGDHGAPLRDPAGRYSHRRRGCTTDCQACPQPLPAHRLLGGGVHRPLLLVGPIPARGASRRPRWSSPEPRGA